MKKIFLATLTTVVILIISIAVNTLRFDSKQFDIAPVDGIKIDTAEAANRLSAAIKLRTISHQNAEDSEAEPFEKLVQLISDSFPKVGQGLEKTIVNQRSLLFKWTGTNPRLKPITFLAHMDVVQPEPNTINEWKYDPFSGAIAEGYIWGRGTLDDKSSVFGLLEAVEHLISQGFVPNRTLYLAFGHDE